MKAIALILLIAAISYFLITDLSTKTYYECQGNLENSAGITKETLFLEVTKYDRVVGLWSKSEGMIQYEVAGGQSWLFDRLDFLGIDITILNDGPHNDDMKWGGVFSGLSRTLNLYVTEGSQFIGKCNTIKR